MHLDDLGLFLRVAQTLSLSETARQLDQTPSAVSARLKRIEEELWRSPRRAHHTVAAFDPRRRALHADLRHDDVSLDARAKPASSGRSFSRGTDAYRRPNGHLRSIPG